MMSFHHTLFEAWSWSARGDAQRLRTTPSLVPKIDRDVHDTLHEQCPLVPILGAYTLRNVVSVFEPRSTTLGSIDSLSSAIDLAARHPRAHFVEKQLCELAIHSLRLQIPYLRGEIKDDWA